MAGKTGNGTDTGARKPIAHLGGKTGKNTSVGVSVWPGGGVTIQKRFQDDKGTWITKGDVSLTVWEVTQLLGNLVRALALAGPPEERGTGGAG